MEGALLFTKGNTPPGVFYTFFKLYEWLQIVQIIWEKHKLLGYNIVLIEMMLVVHIEINHYRFDK